MGLQVRVIVREGRTGAWGEGMGEGGSLLNCGEATDGMPEGASVAADGAREAAVETDGQMEGCQVGELFGTIWTDGMNVGSSVSSILVGGMDLSTEGHTDGIVVIPTANFDGSEEGTANGITDGAVAGTVVGRLDNTMEGS